MGDEQEDLVTPASLAQQGIWVHDQVSENRSAHHVTAVIEIEGRLDVSALEASLIDLSLRHEALRTAFRFAEGQLSQIILRHASSPLKHREVGAAEFDDVKGALLCEPFDLSEGRLWRVHLLRFAPDRHVAVLVAHHIVIDAVSSAILLEELAVLYAGHADARPAVLAPLEVQFADYAVWQRGQRTAHMQQQLLDHWREQLRGAQPLGVLDLEPGSRPADIVTTVWGVEVTEAVSEAAGTQQATSFMVILACYAALLGHRYGQEDISVLSPVDGRTRPELERVVGYFVDVVPIRVQWEVGLTFGELLNHVRRSALAAFQHQGLPMESLAALLREVGAEGAERACSGAMMVIQQAKPESFVVAGVEFRIRPTGIVEAKADVVLDVKQQSELMVADVEFDTRLLSRSQVEAFASDLTALLAAAPGRAHVRIDDMIGAVSTVPRGEWAKPLHARSGLDRAQKKEQNTLPLGDLSALEAERAVMEIWSEVFLGAEVRPDSDFFDMGGQSLDAVRFAALISERFGVKLKIARDLYPDFTVAAVAAHLIGLGSTRAADSAREVGTVQERELIVAPASAAQEGMWADLSPDRLDPVVLGGLLLLGPLDANRLIQASVDIALRHETLRSGYRVVDGELTQFVSPDSGVEMRFVSLASADRFGEVVREQVRQGFDLERGPLMRWSVLRVSAEEHIVFLHMHHLISDGRSVEILLRDALAFYAGDAAALPPLPVPFREIARRHREQLEQGREADAVRYWKARLEGVRPIRLPRSGESDGESFPPGLSLESELPAAVFDEICELSARHRSTVNAVCLSAFVVLLAGLGDERDIPVRIPVSYRDWGEAADVVADFSNDIVTRVDLRGDPTWSEIIDRVTRGLIADLTHHDLPPNRLAPHLSEPGLLGRLFQVQFTTEQDISPPSRVGPLDVSALIPPFPYAYKALSVRVRLGARPHTVWIVRADMFSAEQIKALAEHFNGLLQELVADISSKPL